MKNIFILIVVILLMGCEESIEKPSGFHFQGRDCMKCHNVDLAESSHQTFGGSVFVDQFSDNDDLSSSCNQPLYLMLLNSDDTVAYDSRDTTNPEDSGFNGLGNIFTLKRDGDIPVGVYKINIVSEGGDIVSTTSVQHTFSGTYSPTNSSDSSNRYSCNACHGVTSVRLYANTRPELCRK